LTTWAARKSAELAAKLKGVTQELEEWKQLSKPGAELEKHHTQILRLATQIETVTPDIQARIANVDDWAQTEAMVLELHRIWDFFRNKLALRQVGVFQKYLALADDFAWECYRPAQEKGTGAHNVALAEVREPPLVFLSGITTPFAISRNSSYEREIADDRVRDFRELVVRLPVPVLGVPWFQLRHLPDALVIAHEVGHLVEDDFGLTPTLSRLLTEALTSAGATGRSVEWEGWLGETFADIYGTLAGGPAFAQALADFAAVSISTVSTLKDYPPVDIRVRIVLRALHESGFPTQAQELLQRWESHAPHVNTVDSELPAVVAALINGPYPEFGGAALRDVINFNQLTDAARSGSADLLARATPEVHDIRALLAAAGEAFATNPEAYTAHDTTERVLKHATTLRHSGIRAASDEPQAMLLERDRARAADLLAFLSGSKVTQSQNS
jgi:hypothetical protein